MICVFLDLAIMRVSEVIFIILMGLLSITIAAPTSYEHEVLKTQGDEPGPGYGL